MKRVKRLNKPSVGKDGGGRVVVAMKVYKEELDAFKSASGCVKNATAIMAMARLGMKNDGEYRTGKGGKKHAV